MLMYSAFLSQTTSSECPAVQMAPQIMTEMPPNLTVGCRCHKENSGWKPPHPDSTTHKTVQTGTRQRIYGKTTVSQNSTGLLIISDPHCFLHSMLKGAKKWLPSSSSTAIPKDMEIVDNSSCVLINTSAAVVGGLRGMFK